MQKTQVQAIKEEMKIYNDFALNLARGIEVVDIESYHYLIDSRIESLLHGWLAGVNSGSFFLDFGCGNGSFSRFIKKELSNKVVGVDVSRGMVKYASTKNKDVNYSIADCHKLPFRDESFDVVLGIGVFHHLNLRTALCECGRVLRKGGFLVISEPNSLGLLAFIGRKMFKTKIHTPNERIITHWSFLRETKKDFQIIDVRFLSFIGFIFPFIWASKFRGLFSSLKRYTPKLRIIDQILERIPITKHFCWQYLSIGVKR